VHPYIGQALAAERARDWQQQAAQARRAKQARRGRRGIAEVHADRPTGHDRTTDIERVPQARLPERTGAAGDDRQPVGARRA